MKTITESEINQLRTFINDHDFFYIVGHKEPDGDCIASCFGVRGILDKMNKPYQVLSAGPFKRSEIKKYENEFSNVMDFQTDAERKKTGLFIVDCSEISRLGEIDGDLNGFDTFIIDHHKTSDICLNGGSNVQGFIDSESPAAAYLVLQFYEKLIGAPEKALAEIFFFGICTDTGFFRFLEDNSQDIFDACGRLVSYGVNPRQVYNEINSGKPYSTRKLLGVLLSKAERYLDGRLVITYETMEDTKLYGTEGRDSDALYQMLLSAKNVEAVVFLRQETISTCTGGFRSLDKIDVSAIASKFGGGGHKNASGMSCNGRVETLIPQIVKEFARVM